MRAVGVLKSQWIVRWKSVLALLLALILLASVIAIISSFQARTVGVRINEHGQYVKNVEYYDMVQYRTPKTFDNTGILLWCLIFLSIYFAGKYRKFFISLSVSRYEMLIGNFLYLASLAVIFIVAAWLTPFLSRMALLLTGFRFASGVSMREIIWGSSKNILFDGAKIFCEFVLTIGISTFVGYLFARWWKIILLLMGLGIVSMIIVVMQVQLGKNLELLIRFADWLAEWMRMSFIPFIEKVVTTSITWKTLAYYFLMGVGFTALSYPILRKMPVKS